MINPNSLGLRVTGITSTHEALVTCPFHGGTGKSAQINLKTGKFYCFKCNKSSDARTIAKMNGCSIKYDNNIIYNSQEHIEFLYNLNNPLAIDDPYLAGRGVTNELVEKYGILSNSNCVIVPCKNFNGSVTGCVIRYKSGKIRYNKKGIVEAWGFDNLDPTLPIVITEGVFGALRGISYGYQAMSLTSSTKGIPSVLIPILKGTKVILFYDNDEAGRNGAKRILKRLPSVKAYFGEADEANKEEWEKVWKL
jgi:DNA primase